jgi:hypothetical protein
MKHMSLPFKFLIAAVLLALAAGCATTASQTKENALSAAGFKIITPATAIQEQKLKTLPVNKVTMIKKAEKIYYVYPDVARNVVYVGGPKQYQAYQQYRLEQNAADENLEAAKLNADDGPMDALQIREDQTMGWETWNGWGAWTPYGWY